MLKLKNYIPQIVYGSVDGTISTTALVAAAYGGGLKFEATLILGIAGLIADGFSMAVSSYLSAEADPYEKRPFKAGLVTFLAFVLLGSAIIVPYFVALFVEIPETTLFYSSLACGVVVFAGVGVLKSKVEDNPVIVEVIQVIVLGLIAAGIAYGLGDLLKHLITE